MRWADVLDLVFPPACAECDAPGSGLCAACFRPSAPVHFMLDDLPCVALGAYEGVLRRAVLAVKSGRRDVGHTLGSLLGERIDRRSVDALVPVLTTAARRRQRGFDQGDLLARAASRVCGVPIAALLRQTAGDAQRGRTREARLAAVGRFSLTGASFVQGSRVVLVDDVATTGATLRDCARTLRAAGLKVTGALVVAQAA